MSDNFISQNPLATQKVGRLIMRFAIPAIVGGLVSALYNIVDQIFIGQSVGLLGNAATNVAFPMVTTSTSMALLFGIGSASNFSLALGSSDKEKAGHIAGTGIVSLAICGVTLCGIVLVFLKKILLLCGATEQVLPYAQTYMGITAIGIPFLIISIGASHIIRADGSPKYAMYSTLIGAILNTVLDALFIFVFKMGIAGAALATVIGQMVSAGIVLFYFTRFKTLRLTKEYMQPKFRYVKAIASLGVAACFNQIAMTVVQITMNNTLNHYGTLSKYGGEIPLACVGVITKVNIIFMAFAIGISQGCQPIIGFNYGAKNYARVKEAYLKALCTVTTIGGIAFVLFQIFPREIVSVFGEGSELYFIFAERYFRVYMMMIFINGVQPLTSNFFTSIGKAKMGILISLTRQILFLLPLIVIFPLIFGIDGVMYAGPISDIAALTVSLIFVVREMRKINLLDMNYKKAVNTENY